MIAVDATAGPLAAGDTIAGCELAELLSTGAGVWRYRASDPGLGRACEVVAIELGRDGGADALARARVLAGHAPPGVQAVHRLQVRDEVAALAVQALEGEPLCDALATGSLAGALACADQVLALLDAGRVHGVAPPRVTAARVVDGRVVMPCAEAVAEPDPGALRAELCRMFAAVAARDDVSERVLAVIEAFDRDLYADIDALRRALARAQMSWARRHRRWLIAAAAIAAVTGGLAVARAWQTPSDLDYIIEDDLPARVAQMDALADRAAAVPHGRGPDLRGAWVDPDNPGGLPVAFEPVGAPSAGQWSYDRRTVTHPPGTPGGWHHAGVLTLRRTEGRMFLTGRLDRTPENPEDDSFIVVEFEVDDADHMRLRSSVFHDPGGAGWSFAYFTGGLQRKQL